MSHAGGGEVMTNNISNSNEDVFIYEHDSFGGRPFCYNDGCICREDQEAIEELRQQYLDGLVSAQDALNIYHGRTV